MEELEELAGELPQEVEAKSLYDTYFDDEQVVYNAAGSDWLSDAYYGQEPQNDLVSFPQEDFINCCDIE